MQPYPIILVGRKVKRKNPLPIGALEITSSQNQYNLPLQDNKQEIIHTPISNNNNNNNKKKIAAKEATSKIDMIDAQLAKINSQSFTKGPAKGAPPRRQRKPNPTYFDDQEDDDLYSNNSYIYENSSKKRSAPSSSSSKLAPLQKKRKTNSAYASPSHSQLTSSQRAQRTRTRKVPGNEFSSFAADVKLSPPLKKCLKILEQLARHAHAIAFLDPVDPVKLNIPDYFDIIKRPMDLGTIRKQIKSGHYDTHSEFAEDVRLIWWNARKYNKPESDIYAIANILDDVFEVKYAKLCEELETGTHGQRDDMAASINELKNSMKLVTAEIKKLQRESFNVAPAPGAGGRGRRPKSAPRVATPAPIPQMSYEQKKQLSQNINTLPEDALGRVVQIIHERNPQLSGANGDEIEIDIDTLDNQTLVALDNYVNSVLAKRSQPQKKGSTMSQGQNQQKIDDVKAQIEALNQQTAAFNQSVGLPPGANSTPTNSQPNLNQNQNIPQNLQNTTLEITTKKKKSSSSSSGSSSDTDSSSSDSSSTENPTEPKTSTSETSQQIDSTTTFTEQTSVNTDNTSFSTSDVGTNSEGMMSELNNEASLLLQDNPTAEILQSEPVLKESPPEVAVDVKAWSNLEGSQGVEKSDSGDTVTESSEFFSSFKNMYSQREQKENQRKEQEEKLKKEKEAEEEQRRLEEEKKQQEIEEAERQKILEQEKIQEEQKRKLEQQRREAREAREKETEGTINMEEQSELMANFEKSLTPK